MSAASLVSVNPCCLPGIIGSIGAQALSELARSLRSAPDRSCSVKLASAEVGNAAEADCPSRAGAADR